MLKLTLFAIATGFSLSITAQTQSNVSTPKGSSVTAYITSELSASERAYWDNYFSSPNRTYIQYFNDGYSSSGRFNCHGYAWNMVEGEPVRWIGYYVTTDEDIYMTDGSYIRVCTETYPGKVSWVGGDHSAITTATPGRWRSKWNAYPLIEHNKDDTPYGSNYAYYASTKITGSTSNLCSGTRAFVVQNIPGATYTWTKSSTVTTVSGGGNQNQITVQRNGSSNGAAWVQVQISTSCSSSPATSRLDFTVGLPQASNIILSKSANSTTIGIPVAFVAGYPPDNRCLILNTQWQVSISASVNTGNVPCEPDNGTSKNIFFQSTGTAYVKAQIQNACGWSGWSAAVPIQVGSGFMISPNPAINTVTVTEKEITQDGITEAKIFDNSGYLKKQSKYTAATRQIQINVADLQTGIYYIEISSGQNKERKQLLIQK
ncbi:MAG: T9SS type A sorting domain-containing protein [Bacteroidetes bacterium]|nr:T9SS type A sorting domain-containing protein [Bacteroidota bacterium]